LHLARQFQSVFAKQQKLMAKLEDIHDIPLLEKMLDETDDFDKKRPIRNRLIELKKKKRMETEQNLQQLADRREQRIATTQAEANAQKDRYLDTYDKLVKTGKFDTAKYKENCLLLSPSTYAESENRLNSPGGGIASLGLKRPRSAPGMAHQNSFSDLNSVGSLKANAPLRSPNSIKDALLRWCQAKTRDYKNVNITNFSSSWADGLAFCALVHHFMPNEFDFSKLSPQNRKHNLEIAFRIAEEKADIMPLLEVDDMLMMGDRPDWKCVFTYVQSVYRAFRGRD